MRAGNAAILRFLVFGFALGMPPALAVEMSGEKNFVVPPNTPSYFTGESAPLYSKSSASGSGDGSNVRSGTPAAPTATSAGARTAKAKTGHKRPSRAAAAKHGTTGKKFAAAGHSATARLAITKIKAKGATITPHGQARTRGADRADRAHQASSGG